MPPKVTKVRTRDNHFQHVDVLRRNREKRHQHRKFFVEGVSSINLALQYGWKFDSVIFAGSGQSDWARAIIERGDARHYFDFAPELLAEVSDKSEPSEIVALVETRDSKLSDLVPHPAGMIVVFDRPGSPGNLGSSIRSADAFGANAVIVSGHAVDLYDPQVLRASVGTFFSMAVIKIESHREIEAWVTGAREQGIDYTVFGTSAKGDTELTDVTNKRPSVLLFGNETTGLSRGYKDISQQLLKIRLQGQASSLNISCAASIVMHHFTS